ncbi:hypothetical protein KVR01_006023 [Diaporthe batatas]|uniref:uncharacterized protein n=1 Tax=Diaporthe batatas TaxID=748121 RepID=UPI001D0370C4|nr:uncharacterized protein KVR01_006023 [Diaporthe batatas]KAG8164105.1 hypothetical protein KVR01_006023 [Diaporthe batatas]
MSMSGSFRHMACKFCRDRKVRCGGEQPSCEKCRRAGEECIYLPSQRSPTKASLAETVDTLQKRLEEAETRITRMGRHSSQSLTPHIPYSQLWPMSTEYLAQASSLLSSDNLNSYSGLAAPSANLYNQSAKSYSAEPTQHDRMGSVDTNLTRPGTGKTDPLQFREEDAESNSSSFADLSARLGLPDHRRASYPRQFFDANTSSSNTSMLDTPQTEKTAEEIAGPILNHISVFSTAVFRHQAEICGIAGVLSEYVAWLRRSPPGVSPSGANSVYSNVLETIEARLRELREIAESRHVGSFHDLAVGVRELVPAGSTHSHAIGDLERDLQKQAADLSHFFKTRYNACSMLSEQLRSMPYGPMDQGNKPGL